MRPLTATSKSDVLRVSKGAGAAGRCRRPSFNLALTVRKAVLNEDAY